MCIEYENNLHVTCYNPLPVIRFWGSVTNRSLVMQTKDRWQTDVKTRVSQFFTVRLPLVSLKLSKLSLIYPKHISLYVTCDTTIWEVSPVTKKSCDTAHFNIPFLRSPSIERKDCFSVDFRYSSGCIKKSDELKQDSISKVMLDMLYVTFVAAIM